MFTFSQGRTDAGVSTVLARVPARVMLPLLLGVAAVVAAVAPAAAQAPTATAAEDPRWHMSLDVGLWATSLAGDVGTANFQTDVDICFTDLVDHLDLGAMGGFALSKGDLLVVFNGMYVTLGDDVILAGGAGGASFDVDMGIADVALGYTLARSPTEHGRDVTFTPAVGVRYTSLSLDLSADAFPGIEENENWWDPYVGALLVVPLGRKLDLRTSGSIGGWGVGSELTWSLAAYLDWHFADWASLNVGYRALSWNYDNNNLVWDTTLHGPWVGVTFFLF